MPGLELILLLLALSQSPDLDDRELARRIREGDHAAFKAFFDRHHAALFHFLMKRGLATEVAEDLIQNAFVMLWERRAEIDPDRSLRAYLFQTCYNRALNHVRDTARYERDLDESAHSAEDQETDFNLMRDHLMRAVAALPEKRRAIFELSFLREFTYRETAEVLGISVKTVENQMADALKSIRKAMEVFRDDYS